MAKQTKQAILDVAQRLFSEQGFNQTSMRSITTEASVNLASVNYHFGSKKNLIQAVFKQYFDVLMPSVEKTLQQTASSEGEPGVRKLLMALIPAMIELNSVSRNGTAIFVQLLGRGYNETQGHLRRFIMQSYGDTVRKLVDAIHARLPSLSDEEIFWRIHFAMGSFVFSMASSQALTEIAEADFNRQVSIEDVMIHLVPFISQGIAGQGK
ncbi:TetR/AcrR family transcriptional regulator [Alteromonas halophila]|uniref:TetR family transcriptional regulator n=1 Tax=Alteromonas halophila TaxID=516698 RepID=A0A918MYG9_9ALTE|nr:TetR/AcrR family transcriptional regulator [Alteromonas halophila]GGW88210.1 TetR family transcriptional regulator [Alteromonas halophila]